MNHDTLLAQLTDEKLSVFQGSSSSSSSPSTAPAVSSAQKRHAEILKLAVPPTEPVEEEAVAQVHTVAMTRASATTATARPTTTTTTTALPAVSSVVSEPMAATSESSASSTPYRFLSAMTQLYNSATERVENDSPPTASNGRPSKSSGMESKLLSMWHNVKYGWSGKMKTNFSKEQPVWLLGRCYHRKCTPPDSYTEGLNDLSASPSGATAVGASSASITNACDATQQLPTSCQDPYQPLNPQVDEIVVPQEMGMDAAENQAGDSTWEEGIEGFRRDFFSRIWMTYRREFSAMNGSNYTSDCGWGCMLRSGQMLLAQGLICHFLGRGWRYDPETQLHSTYEDNIHKKIIKWFGDSSSKSSPFSIHAMVNLGETLGKKPGDWYGPASVSYLLRQALIGAANENADFDNITIYVAKDCTIYMEDVENECLLKESTRKTNVPWQTPIAGLKSKAKAAPKERWKSVIVLVPLRLGSEKLNVDYAHCLKLLLSTEYCIGIIGGRPKHSLYFVGFQEDKLIHLDPHYCQEMVDVNQDGFLLQTFHCKSPRKLKVAKMDPSCCIGFYCQTKQDFQNFVESVQLYLNPLRCAAERTGTAPGSQQQQMSNSGGIQMFYDVNYPLFTFSRGKCLDYEQRSEMSDSLYKSSASQQSTYDDDSETEEFVLL